MHDFIKSARRADGPTLAAVAIARNEIRDIKGFIENLSPWIDEIVVVDDGSTDGTLEYLRSCGRDVIVVERRLEPTGGFAAQRNAGLAAATSNWVVHMDIDERVPPELAVEMREAIRDTTMNAFRYKRLNYFLHRPFMAGGWQHWNAPQLARRGAHRFVRPLHEQVEVEGGNASIGQLSHAMIHLNDDSFVERLEKNAQYAPMTARRLLEEDRKKIGPLHLTVVPLKRAFKAYVLEGGYRHGVQGLIFAIYTFTGTFNWYACAWDEQNRIDRSKLEEALRQAWAGAGHAASRSGNESA